MAQRGLPVASATANPRRIGRAAPVTPYALPHSAPRRCFQYCFGSLCHNREQQRPSKAAVIALTPQPLILLTLRLSFGFLET